MDSYDGTGIPGTQKFTKKLYRKMWTNKKKKPRELTGPLKNEDLTGSVDGNAGRQQLRAEIRQQSQNERKISARR